MEENGGEQLVLAIPCSLQHLADRTTAALAAVTAPASTAADLNRAQCSLRACPREAAVNEFG